MSLIELKIVNGDVGNLDKCVDLFLKMHAKISIRDSKICQIIDDISDNIYDLDLNILGATYQSSWRDKLNLASTSHMIKSIRIKNGEIYGIIQILNTPMGKPLNEIDSSKMILRPVFSFKMEYPIIETFDIDFEIKDES